MCLIKILLFLSKKLQRHWANFKIRRSVNDNQMVKKYKNSGEDHSINTRLNLKIRFLGQKKKRIKIRETSSSIFLKRSFKSRPGFTDNFVATFVNIRFMIISRERLARMLIRVSKIFNCKASFRMLLSMWLVIAEKEL